MWSLLAESSEKDPRRLVEQLAALWVDGHRPTPRCSDCESCWMELDEASRAVVLAHSGSHPYLGWGPVHMSASVPRNRCIDCKTWLSARSKAELRLTRDGFVPTHWLAPKSATGRSHELLTIAST
jgi:hypothetical protein